MNNICDISDKERRYGEASEWIAKMDKTFSVEDQKAMQTWMAASPKNEAVLLEMAKLWDKMGVLSRLSDLFPEATTGTARSRRYSLAMAASVLLVVLAGVWTAIALNPSDTMDVVVAAAPETVYETAIGEQATATLADGTVVVLNTNSLMEVEYGKEYRLLRLQRGEIHVQVAEDKDRPLSVIAGDHIVQAVGTSFSVEITSDQQIELVVTEGKVLVSVLTVPKSGVTQTAPAISAASSVVVAEGQELILGSPQEEVISMPAEEIEVRLSWREGRLIFRGESLEEALTEVSRYTTVEFVFLDDDLKQERISGRFRAGDVDALLIALRQNFDITNQRTDDGKVLLSSL